MKAYLTHRNLLIFAVILVFALLRIWITIPNVSPVAALALFGGAMFNRKSLGFVLPLMVLALSDAFIGFYSIILMAFVYGAVIMISLLSRMMIRRNPDFRRVIAASISSSVLFFIVTNLGVWAEGLLYPRTLNGLVDCFYMGLPFFRFELLGTLAFTTIFFGLYAFAVKLNPKFSAA